MQNLNQIVQLWVKQREKGKPRDVFIVEMAAKCFLSAIKYCKLQESSSKKQEKKVLQVRSCHKMRALLICRSLSNHTMHQYYQHASPKHSPLDKATAKHITDGTATGSKNVQHAHVINCYGVLTSLACYLPNWLADSQSTALQ